MTEESGCRVQGSSKLSSDFMPIIQTPSLVFQLFNGVPGKNKQLKLKRERVYFASWTEGGIHHGELPEAGVCSSAVRKQSQDECLDSTGFLLFIQPTATANEMGPHTFREDLSISMNGSMQRLT